VSNTLFQGGEKFSAGGLAPMVTGLIPTQPGQMLLAKRRCRRVSKHCHFNSVTASELMRCQQHPGDTAWLPLPVRNLFQRMKWCSSFRSRAYSKIVLYAWFKSLLE